MVANSEAYIVVTDALSCLVMLFHGRSRLNTEVKVSMAFINLTTLSLGMIYPIETFTSVYNLYLYYTR